MDREAFLEDNQSLRPPKQELPKTALEDLKYFEQQALKGRALRFEALQEWIKDKYGFAFGRAGLKAICKKHDIQAWWSSK